MKTVEFFHKNFTKLKMDQNGIRVFWFENGEEMEELLIDDFYSKEFDLKIVGRMWNKNPGVKLKIEIS